VILKGKSGAQKEKKMCVISIKMVV